MPKTVVVLGGTGHFGARICRRIVTEPDIRLIVAGRNPAHAESLVAELRHGEHECTVDAAALDQDSAAFASDLHQLTPDVVIHTAGPYQGQDYSVARACIECGCHYVDLSDGREFVAGFSQLDKAAADKGVLLVTGTSTLPGISSAVVKEVESEFAAIEQIATTIAPAHRTPRGLGTVRAVLSYCGQPFSVLENGVHVRRHGWQDLRVYCNPFLGVRLSAACDVPDLALFPDRIPSLRSATFHAALEAWWEHIALWLMAWLSRAWLVEDWTVRAHRFASMSKLLIGLGSDRGGMSMNIAGTGQDGQARAINWRLDAGLNHGPEIPCTPALVIARRLIRGTESLRGAHTSYGLVTMAELAGELSGFDICWGYSRPAE